jgi:hypothetical protein
LSISSYSIGIPQQPKLLETIVKHKSTVFILCQPITIEKIVFSKGSKAIFEIISMCPSSYSKLKRKVKEGILVCKSGFAGHWARVPPDPFPNSEVKPCSVPRCIVVFGHEKPGKLATHLTSTLKANSELAKLYN